MRQLLEQRNWSLMSAVLLSARVWLQHAYLRYTHHSHKDHGKTRPSDRVSARFRKRYIALAFVSATLVGAGVLLAAGSGSKDAVARYLANWLPSGMSGNTSSMEAHLLLGGVHATDAAAASAGDSTLVPLVLNDTIVSCSRVTVGVHVELRLPPLQMPALLSSLPSITSARKGAGMNCSRRHGEPQLPANHWCPAAAPKHPLHCHPCLLPPLLRPRHLCQGVSVYCGSPSLETRL